MAGLSGERSSLNNMYVLLSIKLNNVGTWWSSSMLFPKKNCYTGSTQVSHFSCVSSKLSIFQRFQSSYCVKVRAGAKKDYQITRFVKLLCSLIKHFPGDCKNCYKKGL